MNDLSKDFINVVNLIQEARENAIRKVNEELILLYWNVGKYISEQLENQKWGTSYIDELASFISKNCPEVKGFNRRGLYRMKQFYETYKDKEFVSTLLTQISWSNHLAILSSSKSDEEREFYIKLSIKERYSVRELQRQLDSGYFERYMLSTEKLEPVPLKSIIKNNFLDTYVLEFLNLPGEFSDIDLLFYHRGLACLVAFELKIGAFKPEHIGKMNFYLEALDREHKKNNENPSVGVILCASKEEEVVEFALSRSLSPTLIAEYTLKLIDKNLLRKKLHELTGMADLNMIDIEGYDD